MSDKVYDIVTEKILDQLESGTVPWRKPWSVDTKPRNAFSGRPYRGINAFLLSVRGFSSPYWMTWKQLTEQGGTLKPRKDNPAKRESSTLVVFWKIVKVKERQDDGSTVVKEVPMLRYFRVWNLDQVDGVKLPRRVLEEQIELAKRRPTTDAARIESADAIVAGYKDGPTIAHDGGGQAFYTPLTDAIHLPRRESFDGVSEYYSTLFHEFGHSTGASHRLNRHKADYQFRFGSHAYGREELVAEMTAAFLCGEAEILPSTVENSAAYLRSWIKTIKEDKRAVVVAAGAAQRAADHILGVTFSAESDSDVEQGKAVAA